MEKISSEQIAAYDLRRFLAAMRGTGEVVELELESLDDAGALAEVAQRQPDGPILHLKPPAKSESFFGGFVSNSLGSAGRIAVAMGIPEVQDVSQVQAAWRQRRRAARAVEPYLVDAPVWKDHVLEASEIRFTRWGVPTWHPSDGGPYIGTAAAVVTRNPDTGRINAGCYRIMVHDDGTLAIYIVRGKDGQRDRDILLGRGERCPVAISFGHHPLVFLVAGLIPPTGVDEWSMVQCMGGVPFPLAHAPVTGLPVPALAELVVEGFVDPDRRVPEGPFGEWTGYYASGQREEYAFVAERAYYREAPILLSSPPSKPPQETLWGRNVVKSADLEDELTTLGIQGIKGVWFHPAGGTRLLTIIKVDTMYAGHSRQVGLAATSSPTGALMGRWIITVDPDIDMTNLEEVIWAVLTRAEVPNAYQILHALWTSQLDTVAMVQGQQTASRILIDACRPFDKKATFPKVTQHAPEDIARARQLLAEARLAR